MIVFARETVQKQEKTDAPILFFIYSKDIKQDEHAGLDSK